MKHRSRIQIVVEILESICINAANDSGATNTKIIYNVFLSYTQLKEYLSLLLRSDLIKYHAGGRTLVITDKGMHLLELYNNLNKVVSIRQITAPFVL